MSRFGRVPASPRTAIFRLRVIRGRMWCKVIPMNESEYSQEADVPGTTCQWCQGTGYMSQALAYAPGVEPFRGPYETVHRAGECRHCRGSGTYDSHRDPTLERWRTQEPRESQGLPDGSRPGPRPDPPDRPRS